MIIHNCASFGSLVHRAQGYKKLKEERSMASRFYIPEPSTRNLSYYLVSENCQAVIKSNGRDDFLEKGSLVFSTSRFQHKQLEVKIVDVNTKNNIPQEIIYRCCPDKLIKINEKVWNLIAPIKSPEDRIKIAKDAALCEELCSIDVGSFVVLYSRFLGKVTAKTTKKDGMGVLFEVSVQEIFENYRSASFEVGDKVIVAADALRLYPFSRRTSPKSRSQNDLNSLDSSQNQLDIDEVDFSNNYGNNKKFRGGDNVMWINKEMFTPATICWSSRIHDKARIHLDTECKEVCCDRSFTKSVSTKDLMSMEEFLRKYNTPEKDRKPSFHARNNQMTDSSRFINLLDLNELQENVSNLKSKSSSSYKDDENLYKLEKNCSPSNASQKFKTQLGENDDDLGIGSVVEVMIKDEPHYGVIKWIGNLEIQSGMSKFIIAGIELEEEHNDAGNGWMQGHKYFDCAPRKAIFKQLSECKKDSRFSESTHLIANIKAFKDCAREIIPGIVEPISHIDREKTFKKYNGIQGHNNSCYLDATLFSMFTFTSVFDSLLLRPANAADCDCYQEVQRVLREEIVNPLRKNLFVHADSVMNLRTLLDNSTSVTGLTCEEKDPEEFLTSLVTQVLKAEPFLKLSSGHEAYYYQLFVEKDEQLILPNVQQLFEQSLISSDIKLKEVPSCLIIQMPRFGKSYKVYPRILPSQLLDVTNVIENSPKECSVCGALAKFECKDCFKNYHNESQWWFSFCETCVVKVHNHEDRRHHKRTALQIPREYTSFRDPSTMPRQYMELFAVLCIETSHYVAFVKCGSGPDTPWCFFDSMADRKGELNGFNIPEMVLCSELPEWLSENGVQEFYNKEDRNLPTYAKRLLCDAYMCMYQSADVMMYR